MLPKNFYDQVEDPAFLKHVLYSDTDSIYVVVPDQSADQLSTEDKMKIADQVSNDINNGIVKYLTEYLLPKSNISINQSSTFFKSEMLMDSIMFLDVKKNYAYKILAKKGKIFKVPKIKYTGIQVVKSDAAKITQDMLRTIIEDVVLDPEVQSKNRLPKITEIVTKYYHDFISKCDSFDLVNISFPGKWAKKQMIINGMQLYNFIISEEIFSMSSAGNFIYCNFKNPKLFTNFDMTKINGICFPKIYDKEMLKQKFDQFQIEIDKELQWSKLFTTTCERIVDLIKNQKEK